MEKVLFVAGKHGKWVLPLGLVAALTLPSVASVMQVAIGPLLAVLLVISFLQIPDSSLQRSATSSRQHEFVRTVLLLLCIQFLLPVVVLLLMRVVGVSVVWQVPITLVAAASSITGGPSIVMMLGGNGLAAIRMLVVSTLLLPITAFPVLAMLPLHASHSLLLKTAVILTLVVFGAYVVAKAMRRYMLGVHSVRQKKNLDGLAAIFLALIVLGLMAAIHTAWHTPGYLALTLLMACITNVGLQLIGLGFNRLFSFHLPIVLGVMTGNRAVAIFLTALPASTYQPFLLFIACYQIPMYLTPLLGNYFYKRYSKHAN